MVKAANRRVAYLGPAGTFSEQAVKAFFGKSVCAVSKPGFDSVLDAVEAQEVEFGVIAIENNTNGTVTHALDLLLERQLSIVGEVTVPVIHHFLTQAGELGRVSKVYAHPQALAQCRYWLQRHVPKAELIAVSSNAEGARRASVEADAAGIAPREAADLYNLKTVAAGIQDGEGNKTRFLVMSTLAHTWEPCDLPYKTSIVFSVANQPGALYRMLIPLAENGVQMVRIESRPARNGQWEYNFFIDLEGSERDPQVVQALDAMRAQAQHWRVLGMYPVFEA